MALREMVMNAAMATAHQKSPPVGATLGATQGGLDPRIAECRRLVSRKALWSAGASLVPIPGLDIAADVAVLMSLLQQINERFGLTQAQIEALSPDRKALAFKAMTTVGSGLIGSAITRELVLRVLRTVGVRLTAKQMTRYIPLAGQALSAALAYSAMRYICYQHINDCARVASMLALPSPNSAKAK
ncbi:MAG: hypothetical protein RLZZ612_1742 [Pseudomonadota bacterium]|jgi:uncharacterized protein (DUF697 family)